MTAPTIDDTWALVARAQAGDMDAFADIYRAYYGKVFRFVQSRIPNHATAEDITSETFARALRYIGNVTWQGKDIGAWLSTLARNLVFDYFKSATVQRSTCVDDFAGWVLPAADDPEAEAVAGVQRAAAERLITEAMAGLTPGQKRVIELRFYEGLSVNETAAVLDRDAGATKTLQHRALAAVRRALSEVPS